MTVNNRKDLIVWGHMHAATSLMNSAWELISDALFESENNGDPLRVSDRLRKLMNEAKKLTADMQHDTRKLFHDSLDDEKPATSE